MSLTQPKITRIKKDVALSDFYTYFELTKNIPITYNTMPPTDSIITIV